MRRRSGLVAVGSSRRWSGASASGAGCTTRSSRRSATVPASSSPCSASPGVGKSRLVQEFLGELGGRALVARGRCLPYGEGITYWPLLEAVKEAVGLEDGDSPEEAARRLAARSRDEHGRRARRAQRVAEMIGLAEACRRRRGGLRGRADALRDPRAATGRCVLVFDDIHWGEATFLDLVEHLADWARDAPILLVCLARPELLERPAGLGRRQAERDDGRCSSRSPTTSARSLIENLVGRDGLADGGRGEDRRRGRRQPALRRGDAVDADRRRPARRENGRWTATGDLARCACRRRSRRCSPPGSTSSAPDERAVIERRRGRGQGLLRGCGRRRSRPRRCGRPSRRASASLVRKELIRPDRPSLGERDLPLPPPPDPRRRLRVDPEGGARRAARAASAAGSSERRASARSSTRRSSATTSSRRTATGPSSAWSTTRARRLRGRRPSGSAPPADGRSSAATRPPA